MAYLEDDPTDGRRLRVALTVAVLLHSLLLAIPSLRSEAVPIEPEEERELVELRPVRFKPPPPPPPETRPEPQPQAVAISVPDLTPQDLEPLRPVELEVVPLPELPDLPDWDPEFENVEAPPEPPAPEDSGPMLVGGDISRPVSIDTPDPRYTEPARRARIQGMVILQLTLDRQGEVSEVKVLRGMPMGLTESAVRTVRDWTYHPATLNGRPVPVYMTVTIHFTLQ